MKYWKIEQANSEVSAALAAAAGISPICADVLTVRGIDTPEKIQSWFGGESGDGSPALSDPFLIRDMKEAADIILSAAESGEPICIYGDYDCDGVTSAAILKTYLESIGADVRYHINMRVQGFGMCESAVREIAESGVKLIITVDNGISAVKEVELANSLGMKVVITDHHMPGAELPPAEAIVDPHRDGCPSPFKDLCGCGVALKLIAAMDGGDYAMAVEQFSDLAAIATIADSVPLRGENREIVKLGLRYLVNTESAGLRAILEHSGLSGRDEIKADDIGFKIAPLINAAGRISSAYEAADLLMEEDPGEAAEKVKRLENLNTERKTIENAIMAEIEAKIKADPSVIYKRVITLYGPEWHHGVVGIVASRIVEKFGKPVFIMHDMDGDVRGSARSVDGFRIHEALEYCGHLLLKYGGHPGAGGFSLKKENLAAFDEALQRYASEELKKMPVYTLHADRLITAAELTVPNIKSLSALEPYGEGCKPPVFVIYDAEIAEIHPLGAGALHTRMVLNWENSRCYATMFRQETAKLPYKTGDRINLLVELKVEPYDGREFIRVYVQDCKCRGINQQSWQNAKEAYEEFRRSGSFDRKLAERVIPERADLETIYKLIRSYKKIYNDVLFSKLDADKISYCKMKIALDIFEELGFITVDRYDDVSEIVADAPKASIESSQIYQSLHII